MGRIVAAHGSRMGRPGFRNRGRADRIPKILSLQALASRSWFLFAGMRNILKLNPDAGHTDHSPASMPPRAGSMKAPA